MRSRRLLSGFLLGCVLASACTSLSTWAQTTAPNEWTWMGGINSNSIVLPGVWGTLGTPSSQNIPSIRAEASNWIDKNGNLWLFGGSGYDANENRESLLNDLWEFNPSTNQWTWMGGSSTVGTTASCFARSCGMQGVYGTLGTPSSTNIPGGRFGASSWTDSSGNFWLYGGNGVDANGNYGLYNDLWEFNPSTNQWAWMGGSQSIFQPGVYGTLGVPASSNAPGGRQNTATWTDRGGNIWLFGGEGFDVNGNGGNGALNDFWEFKLSTNQWTWMGGNNTACPYGTQSGIYGTLGTPASGNIPSCRLGSTSWTDSNGNFWLFGGEGRDITGYWGNLNDVWEFNPSTDQWAWMGGTNTIDLPNGVPPGVYGTLGTPAAGNIPEGRSNAASWTDSSGNFWLYGGLITGFEGIEFINPLNDLWEFNPSTNEWAWMGGYDYFYGAEGAFYGSLGVPAPGNNPGARWGSAYWIDRSGNFWLFGGVDGSPSMVNNDLWEYQPANGPLPTTATPTLSIAAGTYTSTQTVAIADATHGALIYYTTDGTTPNTSSTGYSVPIIVAYSGTLKAISVANGCLSSAVATATYTLPPQAATPIFSVPAGTYTSTQIVAITDTTPGATIYYTTNRNPPNAAYTLYSGPITVSSTETLEAIATASGYSTSAVANAAYTINLPTPAFAVSGPGVTFARGATTGNTSIITVTPVGGFTGSVVLTAAITSGPTGAQYPPNLSFGSTSPVSISGATAGAATLTISTTAPSSAALILPKRTGVPWYAAGGAALACLLLLGIPARRCRWETMIGMLLLLVALTGGVIACGGGGSGGIGGGGMTNPGTTAGTYTVAVTGISGATTATGTVTLTVQ